MKNAKVSIITVSYNSVATIEQTIKSVVNQTYLNREYIVIDGGSTDGTLDIIHKYEAYISYWCSEQDFGIYHAMNKGIEKATGDIVAFLNSDDYYIDDTVLEKVIYKWNMHENIDVLAGRIDILNRFSLFCGVSPKMVDLEQLCYQMVLDHPAMFARKEIFYLDGFFDLKYRVAADYAWVLNAFHKKRNIVTCDDIFTVFRLGGASSNLSMEMIEEVKEITTRSNPDNMYQKYKGNILKIYDRRQEMIRRNNRIYESIKLHRGEIRRKIDGVIGKKEIAIWGYGMYGQECHEILDKLGYAIHTIIDNDKEKWQKNDQIEISGLQILESFDGIVIITPSGNEEIIERQIKNSTCKKSISTIRYTEIIKIIDIEK